MTSESIAARMHRTATALTRVDPYLVLTLFLTLFALAPLLGPGYFFTAHDGRHSVFYTVMFDESFRSGALWPRWAMHHNQGYGYPTFLIQAPLAFYVAQFFMLLGAGATLAVKWGWVTGFLAGAWGMHALVRRWTAAAPPRPARPDSIELSALAPVVAALLYVYLPYRFLDIYVRGAYAEFMVMAWLPWTVLAFDRLLACGRQGGWGSRLALAALSLAGLYLTHVFALPTFTPFLALFILFRLIWPDRDPSQAPFWRRTAPAATLALAAGLAGLLLTAVFLLPLLLEGPLLDQEVYLREGYDYQRHWLYWGQFLNPYWGFGYSDDPGGVNDGMGFQVGSLWVVLALWGSFLLLSRRRPRSQQRDPLPFLLVASLAILFMSTPGAAPLWARIPGLGVIQFPWRLLAYAGFALSAGGGLVVGRLTADRGTSSPGAIMALLLLVIYAGLPYARAAALQPPDPWREDGRAVMEFEAQHPDMLGYTRWVTEPFTQSPLSADYAHPDFPRSGFPHRLSIVSGSGEVLDQSSLGHGISGTLRMAEAGTVEIRTYYFPGWRAWIDGVPAAVEPVAPHGLMAVALPAGEHRLELRFGTTPPRTAGSALSWAALLALAGLAWWERRRPG